MKKDNKSIQNLKGAELNTENVKGGRTLPYDDSGQYPPKQDLNTAKKIMDASNIKTAEFNKEHLFTKK